MPAQQQGLDPWKVRLTVAFVVLAIFIYLTKSILLPFVAGFAVAYLLDPMADRLEGWGLPRWAATILILTLFFVGGMGLIFALAPILQNQLLGMVENIPNYVSALRPLLDNFLANLHERFDIVDTVNTEGLLADATASVLSALRGMALRMLEGSLAIFSILGLLLISPVVAFFLLRDYDLIIAKIDSLLPRERAGTVRKIAGDVDRALAGFVRGQTLVSLIMAILYAIGWSLVGLEYGLALGLMAGVMAFVPFVGALFAALIAVLLGFGQFGPDMVKILQILGVFGVVQVIEGGFLTPKLIGDRVGLHPVWVLFAIFAGGEVLGFVGVLIALPAAAAIGVMVRYLVNGYLSSSVHLGNSNKPTAKKTPPEKKPKNIKASKKDG